MPAVQAPAKVLVTGASGFIAAWVIKILLEKGYTVVGTVRSKSKGEYLTKLYGSDKFSFVVVEDIEKEGAFDEAVVGVDAVEHTASPFHFKAEDPNELIGPAVKGTVGILESIKKHAPGVKRVVITSSVASVVHDKAKPATGYLSFDESDWNVDSPKIVEEKGNDTPPVHKYRASKVLAERAAWDFVEKNKGVVGFDIVTVCPPMVWGPTIHEVPSVDKLNTSVADFHAITTKQHPEEKLKPAAGNWVDVRDVALVHALALGTPEAGGERFITSGGPFAWQDILDVLHASGEYPDVPKGFPGSSKDAAHMVYVASKAERVFGIKFKTREETIPATLASLKERGFQ